MKKHAADWVPEAPTPAQLKELFAQIENRRVTKERLQDFLAGKDIKIKILRLLVDYSLGIEDLLSKYSRKNIDITSEHFPNKRIGQREVEIKLYHFYHCLVLEQVIAEMKRDGFRPAEAHELLIYGINNPDEQKMLPIVGLGSVWVHWDGYDCGVCIEREAAVSLVCLNRGWDKRFRFLAVREL